MNRRKLLTISTISILLLGIISISVPLLNSFAPSAKANSNYSRIDISEIKKGKYKFFKHPTLASLSTKYKWGILAYRKHDNSVKAWNLPMQENSVGLPDLRWWRPTENCTTFGPTLVNGLIDETQPIKCHDKKQPAQFWVKEWQWNIDGKSQGKLVDDLIPTMGIIEGDFLVIKRG